MLERDQIFKAVLKSLNHIEINVAKSYNYQGCKEFFLYEDGVFVKKLHIFSKSENSKAHIYQIDCVPELSLGKCYEIYDERNIVFYLDCSCLCRYDKYVDRLYYDGQLGAIYEKEGTTFRVFSPIASVMSVYIYNKNDGKFRMVTMEKNVKTGVWEGYQKGDLDGFNYTFIAKVNNEYNEFVDPYARAVTKYSRRGVIINPKKVEVDLNSDKLPPFHGQTDAIIYELHVRDLSSDKNISFANKGKYLAFTEHDLKTPKGLPVGIDYLKSLGITHVQIQPMYDFCTTNDTYFENTYNWGYDPLNYNVPEGSFSSNADDPYSRIIEAKKMIASLHNEGMRVVMDVVYNHVFNLETSNFEACCPNYYFRYNEDGSISNGSFCGNEFESRHPMGRKFIVDSCAYWVKEYGIDGLRFDLMGLLDIKTINEVYETCKKINPDFIMYGEGWDMPTCMNGNQKASMNNSSLTPNVGYFNDRYRDVSKGKTDVSELYMRGYLTGDTNYRDGFKHIFAGSTLPIAFPPLFNEPEQSLNYVECHDNNTLFDKLKVCCYDDSIEDILKRIKLINACTMLAEGIPFFHMGQEIGLSKNGDHNSYQSGDAINQFKWNELDDREDLYNFFRQIVALRKQYKFFRISTKEELERTINFVDEANGCLRIEYLNKEAIAPFKDVRIYINPTKNSFETDLDDYYQIILNESGTLTGELYSQHLVVNGLSLVVCVLK